MAVLHLPWTERVEFELSRRGVPARYRRRLLAELRDHAEDLKEGMMMPTEDVLNARLGDAETLAAQAAEEYRQSRWTSRHPLLVFGLLPLPVTLLVVIATLVLFGLVAYGIGWLVAGDVDDLPRPAVVALAYSAAWGVRFVPFVLLVVLFSRLYLRSQVSRWWLATAAAQVLVVAGSLVSSIQYNSEPGQSAWMLGFAWMPVPLGDGWALPFFNLVGWMQALQIAVPLAAGALVFHASHRRQVALAVRE
jgi:hypothetical protein